MKTYKYAVRRRKWRLTVFRIRRGFYHYFSIFLIFPKFISKFLILNCVYNPPLKKINQVFEILVV